MQSADAEALAATVRREPASRATDSRAPSADGEPKPIGRRRNTGGLGRATDSGRKKTVDERLKRDQAQAPSRVRVAKNDRAGADDEVTRTRSAASLVEEATNAAAAVQKYDDLDEDTRVLSGKEAAESVASPSVEAGFDRAVEALAGGPETELETNEDAASATDVGFAWSQTMDDGPQAASKRGQAPVQAALADARAIAVGVASMAVPSTERAAPIPVLAAVRVAVLPGNLPGEARIVVLDGVSTPPAGAVHAVLLPLTSADGTTILRLLGG
jgi:hypothetical protein